MCELGEGLSAGGLSAGAAVNLAAALAWLQVALARTKRQGY